MWTPWMVSFSRCQSSEMTCVSFLAVLITLRFSSVASRATVSLEHNNRSCPMSVGVWHAFELSYSADRCPIFRWLETAQRQQAAQHEQQSPTERTGASPAHQGAEDDADPRGRQGHICGDQKSSQLQRFQIGFLQYALRPLLLF